MPRERMVLIWTTCLQGTFIFSLRFVSFRFVSFRFVSFRFVLFCFVLFCFVLFCFVLFCFVLFCFVYSILSSIFVHFNFDLFFLMFPIRSSLRSYLPPQQHDPSSPVHQHPSSSKNGRILLT